MGRKAERKIYCLDDRELSRTQDQLKKGRRKPEQLRISRFKGLGEMKSEQLSETTLHPDTRRLLPVSFGTIGEAETTAVMDLLMAGNRVNGRRSWMEALAGDAAETDV